MSFLNNSGLTKLLTLLKGQSFPASDVFDWAKQRTKPIYTANEVGLGEVDNTSDIDKPVSDLQQKAINLAYKNANIYTDTEIGKLVNGSPDTLNTIYKIAEAITENEDIINALDSAIGSKADKNDFENHISDDTVHVTATQKKRYEEAYTKSHEHENKDILDSITYTMLDSIKNFSTHIADKTKHTTPEEKELWNTVTTKVEQIDGMGLSTNDFTNELREKLGNLNAEEYAKKAIYGDNYISLGRKPEAIVGFNSVAIGNNVEASGDLSHAEGDTTSATGRESHAEGINTIASFDASHAEGSNTISSGRFSHSEGYNTVAEGFCSHTEGCNTNAKDTDLGGSHAEGHGTIAETTSHAEGYNTTASYFSHAEGFESSAQNYSHAEGYSTIANGYNSHAEGFGSVSSGDEAHAEGYNTVANGNYGAHAEGMGTIASSMYQHVQGKYNIEDTENVYLHIVGNGFTDKFRRNAHTLDIDGNAWFAGDVANGNGISLDGLKTLIDNIEISGGIGIHEMTYEETMAELDSEGLILMTYQETMDELNEEEE